MPRAALKGPAFCPHCGKQLEQAPNFCPICGGDLRGLAGESSTLVRRPEPGPAAPASGGDPRGLADESSTLVRCPEPGPAAPAAPAAPAGLAEGNRTLAVPPPAHVPELPPPPLVIAGRYKVLELLGQGGMGAVYKVEHTKMGKMMALKLMRPEFARNRAAVDRFVAEARIVSKLTSPNTVSVFDFGEAEDGGLFIAMEYCPGGDVAGLLETEGRLPERRAAAICAQLLTSLGEAHELGVVHRDVKPANVMLLKGRRGEDIVKVLDFGIAKLAHARDAGVKTLTSAGEILGTPNYMSPEQGSGTELGPGSDIYSVGAMLFELVTGRPPFDAPTAMGIVAAHITRPAPRPTLVAPDAKISPAMEELILRALEKDPARRYRSADEMRDVLERIAAGTPVAAAAAARAPASAAPPAPAAPRERVQAGREGINEWFEEVKLAAAPAPAALAPAAPAAAPPPPEKPAQTAEQRYLSDPARASPELEDLDKPYESHDGRAVGVDGLTGTAGGLEAVKAGPAPGARGGGRPPEERLELAERPQVPRTRLEALTAERPKQRSKVAALVPYLVLLVVAGGLGAGLSLPEGAPLHRFLPESLVGPPPKPRAATLLRVTSVPAEATVLLGGEVLGVTPLDTVLSRVVGEEAELLVRKPGFAPALAKVVGGKPFRLDVKLVAEKPVP